MALILTGLMVISSTNAVHSVLWLVAAFICGVVLFISLGSPYLGLVLLVVYVGAIAVLFIFVVMMLDLSRVGESHDVSHYIPLVAITGSVLLGGLGDYQGNMENVGVLVGSVIKATTTGIGVLGGVLYGTYGDLLIIGSYVLLVAMIGAIVLTSRESGAIKRQEGVIQIWR